MAQRPHSLEYTALIPPIGRVVHYTCNAPEQEVLDRHGIKAIGNSFNCTDQREVLLIPQRLYYDWGYSTDPEGLKIVSEQLLRRLE
ncbi:MAG: hypothetical protein AABX63_03720 [Nanoarchaeota archaeon]